jgi:hypothetical protein
MSELVTSELVTSEFVTSELATTDLRKQTGMPRWAWLLLALVAAAFLAANAHLVYVATESQPACVAHTRPGGASLERGQFAAAQSSCSPHLTSRTGSP